MRIDKFLNIVNLVKRRAIAQDMCASGVVRLNGNIVKSSKEVKVGDMIELVFFEKSKKIKILELPQRKTLSKQDVPRYIQEL